jgi:ketosteroid isomerase-like protein
MRTVFREIENYRGEVEQYCELDAENVLVLARGFGRAKLSGVPVSSRSAEVFEVRDGKVTRIVVYYDREHAISDLGLTPEADPHDWANRTA